jgi:hypothetical protein
MAFAFQEKAAYLLHVFIGNMAFIPINRRPSNWNCLSNISQNPINTGDTMKAMAILFTIFLLMLPIIAHAQNQNELIQSLYLKSGMDKQVKQLPHLIRASLEQALEEDDRINQLPRHTKSALSGSVQEAFAPERLKKTIIKEVKESMTVKDLDKVFRWLDSPLGEKCTRLEEAASTPETLSEIRKFAARLQQSPPAANRLDILKRLDAAVKATETNVEITMNTQLAVAFAVVKSLPIEQQGSLEDIAAQLEKNRPHIEAVMRSQTLLFALYAYQDLTNAELEKYIQFATSPAGTKYHGATISGFKKALLDGSLKWGESIADILNQSQHQSET